MNKPQNETVKSVPGRYEADCVFLILGNLRNVVLMLHTQLSSRHKNCRIGGLIINTYLKFNSKQSSNRDLMNK